MSWVAVAIGGAAVIGGGVSLAESQASAEAAQNAANQQQGMAQQAAARANKGVNSAIDYAAASPQELNALGQSYSAASRQLAQQQQLMDAVDPALMSASKQALSLLNGGTAAVNNPLMAQRNQQRAALVNSLQSQYGPGAESTSVGQRALNNFDMQTNTMFQSNQQTSLAQMMGIAGSGGQLGGGVGNAITGLQQVGQGYGNIQTREANTALGGVSALQTSNAGLLQTAGAGSVGAGLQGQAGAAFGNNLMNGAVTLGAAYYRNPSAVSSGSSSNPAAGMQGTEEGVGFNQPSLGSSYASSNPSWQYTGSGNSNTSAFSSADDF